MRQLTAPEAALLEQPNYASYVRLSIEDLPGDLVDRTDWMVSVAWRGAIDSPIFELDGTLILYDVTGLGTESLSPLMNIAIDVGRRVVLDARVAPEGGDPGAFGWKRVFDGTIYRVDFAHDPLTFAARGPFEATGTRWIEADTEYGTEVGQPLSSVMQAILDDWADGTPLTVPVDPPFLVTPFTQEPMSVQDALQRLAALIGWIVQVRWDGNTEQLVLMDPGRERTDPQWAFGPSDYYDVQLLNLNLDVIRNAITIEFTGEDGETQSVTGTNPESIARYGRLWMQITEGTDSPIDTEQEATIMLGAAVEDLSFPQAEQAITTKFFWPAEIGDLYDFLPNGVHYAELQRWAVVSWEHVLSMEEDTTTITVRGHPRGSYRAWRGEPGGEQPIPVNPFGNVTTWVESINEFNTVYGFTASGTGDAESWGFATSPVAPPEDPVSFGEGRYFRQPAFVVSSTNPTQFLSWWFYSGAGQTGVRGERIVVEMSFVEVETTP